MNNKVISILLSLTLLLLTACSQAIAADSAKIILGEEYWHNSKYLKSTRKYQVSLPERYESAERRYPTLYIVDSEFHFLHVASTVKHLTRMGQLPPMIVVGAVTSSDPDYVMHTTWPIADDTNKEFGGINAFNQYIEKELVPIIDKEYKTNGQRALAGYSLGGLFVLNNYLSEDSMFNAFLAMSPSVWYDEQSIINRFETVAKQRPLRDNLYLSLANEQGMGVTELVAKIENQIKPNIHWQFNQFPEENHFTTALPALVEGLKFLAPDYGKDGGELMALGDYKAVLAYFSKLKAQWGGFRIDWLQAYQFGKYVFWSGQTDQINDILSAVKKQFPESHALVAIHLSQGFIKTGKLEKAETLIAQVRLAAKKMPEWYKAKADLLAAQDKKDLAKAMYQRAIELAKQYRWHAWEVNGLKAK